MLNTAEQEWQDLLLGETIWCDKYELFAIIDLMQQHRININTLKLQSCTDGSFVCKVDEPTIGYYKNKK